GHVSLRSQVAVVAIADNITMYDSPISCTTARRFVAGSSAARYAGRNARFAVQGCWCGSELFFPMMMRLPGPQSFTCERGNFTNVTFKLRSARG
ncbi:MAG: hypothetical protein FWD42_10700, partial [Solirubrobacterales bacterium]|nr:hypothetical protein [Solirubrobacterales bacterium]